MSGSHFDAIGRVVDAGVTQDGVPGAAVAVAVGGRLVYEHYSGEASPGRAADERTIWPLASISKMYTATLVMRLVERGELTLSQRVETFLPKFSGEGREKVTLRHLMTHLSGLVYESPDMPGLMARQTPYDEIVDEAYTLPLLFAPAAKQAYSDLGFALAGRVASVATGRPFPELVRELVLDPAGLHDTYMPPPPEVADRVAQVVGVHAEGTEGAMYNSAYARNLAHPAFGTLATVRDLLSFGLLFAPNGDHRILSPVGLKVMTTDQTGGDFPGEVVVPPEGVIHPWGIGWMIKGHAVTPDLVSPASFGHAGASGCQLWIDPEWDVVVAYVSNRHLNLSWDDWQHRIDRVVNVVMSNVVR